MLKKMLAVLPVALLATSVSASNFSFLEDSIISDLSKEDTKSLKDSIKHSLDDISDKQTLTWKSGSEKKIIEIKPKLTYQQGDTTCRRTEFMLREYKHPTERYHFEICKLPEGWTVSDSPIKSFSIDDLKLFAAQLYEVLDSGNIGKPSSWINPSSGNSAVIVPAESIDSGSRKCRKASISIFDRKGRSADGQYIFCQREDGKWRRP